VNFAELCQRGFAEDPANQVDWLKDQSPVEPRPGRDPAKDFSFEELCKIYCWYAKKRKWFCFPDDCESNAEGIRSAGIGLPRADFDPFLKSAPDGSAAAAPPPREQTAASSLPPASQWYYLREGVEAGPFTSDGLRSEAQAGRITPSDQVRRGDLSKWVPASRVKGLFAGGAAERASTSEPTAQPGAADGIDSILEFGKALPPPWSAELDGKKNGAATAFLYADVETASLAYKAVCKGLGKNFGMVARLGDEARFYSLHSPKHRIDSSKSNATPHCCRPCCPEDSCASPRPEKR